MEKKKSKKSKLAHECPNCGEASETKDQFCNSCEVTYQQILEIIYKRFIIMRRWPLFFLDGVCLYRIWRRKSRGLKVYKKGKIIDDWFGENRHNKAVEEKFYKLHFMFNDFMASTLVSEAEKKVEEMLRVLEEG